MSDDDPYTRATWLKAYDELKEPLIRKDVLDRETDDYCIRDIPPEHQIIPELTDTSFLGCDVYHCLQHLNDKRLRFDLRGLPWDDSFIFLVGYIMWLEDRLGHVQESVGDIGYTRTDIDEFIQELKELKIKIDRLEKKAGDIIDWGDHSNYDSIGFIRKTIKARK